MSQRFNQWNEVSRLLLVVCAILVCPGVVAQNDDFGSCCPRGFIVGELLVVFEVGTPRERVDEIATELGFQVTRFSDTLIGAVTVLCVPIGKEFAFASTLSTFPEVRSAERSVVFCIFGLPDCECSLCGFDDPSLPPCDPECELDADGDSFADHCDTCTDTDGDGFGDPEFDASTTTCPVDNCPDAVNPEQADLDSDGIGDECDRRLTVCHRPPGKPAGTHTITIAQPAFPAHLAHGDVPGACVLKRHRR